MDTWNWSEPMVKFRGFAVSYGENHAVQNLSFDVRPGRVCGLLGSNGAGKTTSLRGLLGLLTPTSGSATVFGEPYQSLRDPTGRVGVSMEGIGFYPALSARRNLEICAAAAGLSMSTVGSVLHALGLADVARRPVGKFSLGMKQRLSLAAALMGDPELLVLDEPTNGLDPTGIRWLRGFLRELADEGRTILVSSHMLAELEHAIDDVVIIQQRLLFAGALPELTQGGRFRLEDCFFNLVGDGGALL